MRAGTVPVAITLPPLPSQERGDLDVSVGADGLVTIHASATDAARLAGRHEFGHVEATQTELRELITREWYAAGCP